MELCTINLPGLEFVRNYMTIVEAAKWRNFCILRRAAGYCTVTRNLTASVKIL